MIDFEAVFAEVTILGVDDVLAREAGVIADELGLRGYDAVHLATALSTSDEVVMVTWDEQLRAAAAAQGLAVASD